MTSAQYYPAFSSVRRAFALNRTDLRDSAIRKMYDRELTDQPRDALKEAEQSMDAAHEAEDRFITMSDEEIAAAKAQLKRAYRQKYPEMSDENLDSWVNKVWDDLVESKTVRAGTAEDAYADAKEVAGKPIDTGYREKDPKLRSAQEEVARRKKWALEGRVDIARYRAAALKHLEEAREAYKAGKLDDAKNALARAKHFEQLAREERERNETFQDYSVRPAEDQYRRAANKPYTAIPKEQNRKRADALARERFLPWQQGQEGSLRYDALAEQVDRAREKLRDYLIKGNLPTDYNLRRKVFQYYPDFKHPDNPFFEELMYSGMTPTEFVAKRLLRNQIRQSEKPLRHMSEPRPWPEGSADMFSGKRLNNPPNNDPPSFEEAREKQSRESFDATREGVIPSLSSQTDLSAAKFPGAKPKPKVKPTKKVLANLDAIADQIISGGFAPIEGAPVHGEFGETPAPTPAPTKAPAPEMPKRVFMPDELQTRIDMPDATQKVRDITDWERKLYAKASAADASPADKALYERFRRVQFPKALYTLSTRSTPSKTPARPTGPAAHAEDRPSNPKMTMVNGKKVDLPKTYSQETINSSKYGGDDRPVIPESKTTSLPGKKKKEKTEQTNLEGGKPTSGQLAAGKAKNKKVAEELDKKTGGEEKS